MKTPALGSAPGVSLSQPIAWGLLAAALLLGLAFRFTQLDARPMHHDEANQAVKFGALLERGDYRYDRVDHHGPTLYYLTLPSAWLRGQRTLAAIDETTVRAVPAVFGSALILLLALFASRLGSGAAGAAALLAAVSPALTYYSRFYIQESLFAFLALAFVIALGALRERASAGRAIACGLLGGLLIATKETWLIIVPAAVVAWVVAPWRFDVRTPRDDGVGTPLRPSTDSGRGEPAEPRGVRKAGRAILLALGAALVVLLVFYSSFFTHPSGPLDWVRSLPVYGARGIEGGSHQHPWHYYLGLLAFSRSEGVTWSEGLVLALALCGAIFAFAREPEALRRSERKPESAPHTHPGFWPRYVCLYSLVTAVIFSALPYKTPWNLLPFYVGFVALAGYGAAGLVALAPSRVLRAVVVVVLAVGTVQLAQQAWRANFRYPSDPRNPYVYAHTSTDFLRLVRRIEGVASVHPDRQSMFVMVIAGPYEQWPLPWYLRRMTRVGYWPGAAEAAGALDAPVVVASEANVAAVEGRLSDRYVSEYYGLRPGVLLTLYIERGLWETYINRPQ